MDKKKNPFPMAVGVTAFDGGLGADSAVSKTQSPPQPPTHKKRKGSPQKRKKHLNAGMSWFGNNGTGKAPGKKSNQ